MARKRMIDPNIWSSEDYAQISTLAKLVFIGLFSNADDAGRGRAKGVYIKSILFPYDETLTVADIERALDEIGNHLSITFYEVNGSQYYQLDHWANWQRVDKPQPSQIPPPPEKADGVVTDDSENAPRTFPDDSKSSLGAIADDSRLIEVNSKEVNSREKDSLSPASQSSTNQAAVDEIVAFLNLTVGTSFKPSSKKTASLVNARLRDGFSIDDFKTVILKKSTEWGSRPDMAPYLRPETLFGTKFEGYLNQVEARGTGDILAQLYSKTLREEGDSS